MAVFKRELAAIQAFAPQIAHEAELRLMLQDIPDLTTRDEVCKLLEPFLSFSLARVTES